MRSVSKIKQKPSETTEILFDVDTNWYFCKVCGHIMGYQFDFKFCPYCRRKIIKTEKRF